MQILAAMTQHLIARIREHRTETPERARFAERLLGMIDAIEGSFEGAERIRLLKLVEETFDHFVELGENAKRAKVMLRELREGQARLLQLVEFIASETTPNVLH